MKKRISDFFKGILELSKIFEEYSTIPFWVVLPFIFILCVILTLFNMIKGLILKVGDLFEQKRVERN